MYLGNQPALSYTSFAKQDFTTSATTNYVLDQAVTNANEIALFINFVRQEPTTAYTASGTTLTLTSATTAGDDMYCIFLGKALQTVNPPAGSVGASQITDGTIGLSKLSATGTKDATTFLRGDNTFASAGGTNTPYFQAYANNQNISNATSTKIQFPNEDYDSGNCYDNVTNYRFTPTSAGKYFVYSQYQADTAAASSLNYALIDIRKNNSTIFYGQIDGRNNAFGYSNFVSASGIITMNGTTDYLEVYGEISGSTPKFAGGAGRNSVFGAYKIIE